VIHVRHATFYLFYARFPNTYLQSISDCGTKYNYSVSLHHRLERNLREMSLFEFEKSSPLASSDACNISLYPTINIISEVSTVITIFVGCGGLKIFRIQEELNV
jgi:hypothetical protein